jgi:hypothetical protein
MHEGEDVRRAQGIGDDENDEDQHEDRERIAAGGSFSICWLSGRSGIGQAVPILACWISTPSLQLAESALEQQASLARSTCPARRRSRAVPTMAAWAGAIDAPSSEAASSRVPAFLTKREVRIAVSCDG